MGNERKLRLIQVAKEFNVGLNTITDFLHKKGIKSDGSPNTLVDDATYAVLEKEFGSNRSSASARNSVRERISQKQTTITLEEAKVHPGRNMLTNALGVWDHVKIDIHKIREDYELLLVCSDGLHGYVSEDTIQAVLQSRSHTTSGIVAALRTVLTNTHWLA